MTGLKTLYNSTFPPPVPPSFTSSLNVSDYLFPGDTFKAQTNNTQSILCFEEGYLFVGRSWTRYGGCHVYTQTKLEEIGQLPNLYLILNISLFGIIL
jgi:hypothetical protein